MDKLFIPHNNEQSHIFYELTLHSLKTVSESLETIISNAEIDFSKFKSAAQNINSAVSLIGDAFHHIMTGIDDLGDALGDTADSVNDLSNELKKAKNGISKGLSNLSDSADKIKDAVKEIGDIIEDLSNEKPLEFVKPSENFKNESDNLFDALSGISDELSELKDTVSKEKITADLSKINNQFNVVMNMLIGELEDFVDSSHSLSDIFLDVSDEDIENVRQGKIADCRNFGKINADRNTGGIVGAMAIEYAKDPEDEIEKPNTLNFTYRSRIVLQGCVNDGNVEGKKDCTGGIVGNAEIGTVYQCENYGKTESESGDYVGGIAGRSDSAIRKSYAKSKVTGERYVGGIAGKGGTVTESYTIVNVSGDENVGSVCGDMENRENLQNNFFLDKGIGTVDGISYSQKAEAIEFEQLKDLPDMPLRFVGFTVTFIADDEVVETQNVKYGEKIANIKYPQIPKKDGNFGTWQDVEAETVTEDIEIVCEYKPYITTLSSVEKGKNGKIALALCNGKFTDKARLHIKDSKKTPPIKAEEGVKVYNVSLLNTEIKGDDTVNIRILNENKDKVSAWVLKNGKWEETKVSYNGKYVILQTKGTENTICLKYEAQNISLIIGVAVVIILLIVAVIIFKKKRKTHTKSV